MIYAVRVYTVQAEVVPAFLAAFQRGGLWTDMSRLLPGHIYTDLLRSPSDSSRFLSIEFWTSINALLMARRSYAVRSFVGWLDRQAIDHEGLGMFVFPPQPGAELPNGVTGAAGNLVGEDADPGLLSAACGMQQ